jgi:hypothetical protein
MSKRNPDDLPPANLALLSKLKAETWETLPTSTRVPLLATTAHEARREIARRWPHRDTYYRGFNIFGACVIMGLVRRSSESSGRLGSKPRNPTPHTAIRFEAEI